MTETEFLDVVKSVRDCHDAVPVSVPIAETSLDSLDLLRLWCELETITGKELTRNKFHPKTTLGQIFQMVNQ